jgi:thiamine pyrophosphokinase
MLAEGVPVRSAIVVCAGGPVRRALPAIPDGALVIAADGGAVEALRLGLRIDRLVGDMDSAPSELVTELEATGVAVERHPTDKDSSDLELSLEVAVREGAEEILVLGGDGGRLDHLMGAALLLASGRWMGVRLDAIFGDALVHVIRDERRMDGTVGELVSLFAAGGTASGVTTEGLRWPLANDALVPGSTLGLSNEFAEPRARVRVREGVLLAIRPGTASP